MCSCKLFLMIFDSMLAFLAVLAPNGACKPTGPPTPHKSLEYVWDKWCEEFDANP